MNNTANELAQLAKDLEIEEILSQQTEEEDSEEEDDNVEGWLDENELMTDEEKDKWNEAASPMQLVLVKACLFLLEQ